MEEEYISNFDIEIIMITGQDDEKECVPITKERINIVELDIFKIFIQMHLHLKEMKRKKIMLVYEIASNYKNIYNGHSFNLNAIFFIL